MTTRCRGVTAWPRAPTMLFARQEQDDLVAQARELVVGVDREERQRLERVAPQRVGNRGGAQDALPAPAAQCRRTWRRVNRRRVRRDFATARASKSIAVASPISRRSASRLGQRLDVAQLPRDRARLRTPAFVDASCSPRRASSWPSRARRRTCANSVLTAPSTRQTSLERCSIASVRKPICRLLSSARKFVGPVERHAILALQRVGEARARHHLGVEAFGRHEQDREVGRVRRRDVVVADRLRLRAQEVGRAPCAPRPPRRRRRAPAHPAAAASPRAGTWRRSAASTARRRRRGPAGGSRTRRARLLPGRVSTFVAYCCGVSTSASSAAELHLAPHAARLHVGQHALQVADAGRERLHLAQAPVHLLQAVGHQLERLAEPLLERGLQLFVDGRAHLLELLPCCRRAARRARCSTVARTASRRCSFDCVSLPAARRMLQLPLAAGHVERCCASRSCASAPPTSCARLRRCPARRARVARSCRMSRSTSRDLRGQRVEPRAQIGGVAHRARSSRRARSATSRSSVTTREHDERGDERERQRDHDGSIMAASLAGAKSSVLRLASAPAWRTSRASARPRSRRCRGRPRRPRDASRRRSPRSPRADRRPASAAAMPRKHHARDRLSPSRWTMCGSLAVARRRPA